MAIALVLGEENSAKKQDENEDDGEGKLPKQERGKSNALTYLILKRKAVMTYIGMPRATRSPRSPAVFNPPIPRGIEFSPRSPPQSPSSFPEVPEKELSLQFSCFCGKMIQ